MSNPDGHQHDTMEKPSSLASKRVMIGLGIFIGLGLLSIAILVVVSLIPVFFENTASSTTTNRAKESDFITNTYASNLNISSTDNTTITDTASIARQLETTTGVSSNSLNVYSVQFGSSGRRRQDVTPQRNKRQTFQCNSRALDQTFTSILIKFTVVYPASCGISDACKNKFLTNARNRLAAYRTGFLPLLLKFADGRTVSTQIVLCNSVIDSSSTGIATTSATITSTTTTYRNILFEQQALAQTNADRATHCVAALTLDDSLRTLAQTYAQQLCSTNTFAHSGNTFQGNPLGENLWATSSSAVININTINGSSPINAWFNEVNNYNFQSPGFTSNTGHFTQLVWQSTTTFGIGLCCIADNTKCIVVANYYPAGNYAGQYPQNVLQPPCSGK